MDLPLPRSWMLLALQFIHWKPVATEHAGSRCLWELQIMIFRVECFLQSDWTVSLNFYVFSKRLTGLLGFSVHSIRNTQELCSINLSQRQGGTSMLRELFCWERAQSLAKQFILLPWKWTLRQSPGHMLLKILWNEQVVKFISTLGTRLLRTDNCGNVSQAAHSRSARFVLARAGLWEYHNVQ